MQNSTIDSLRYQFQILESHYDSLNKVTDSLSKQNHLLINRANEFGMAENYFSDILNSQLTIFSVIIGAIALISFAGIYGYLKRGLAKQKKLLLHQKRVFNNQLIAQEKSFNKISGDLKTSIEETTASAERAELQVLKAMYFTSINSNYIPAQLIWQHRILKFYCENPKWDSENYRERLSWLPMSDNAIKHSLKKEDLDQQLIDELQEVYRLLQNLNDEQITKKVIEVKNKILEIFYSKDENSKT